MSLSILKSLLFLSLFLILLPSYHTEDIFDPASLQEIPLEFLDEDTPQETNRLLADNYDNLRIEANYDNLVDSPADYASYIQNELVPPVLSWLQAALKVKSPVVTSIKLGTSTKSICGVAVPSGLYTGIKADLLVLFNAKIMASTSTVASSKVCYLSSATRRPMIATSVFNRNTLTAANGDVLIHERNIYLTIHEMMHNLAFSSQLFPYFIDDNGNTLTGHIKKVTYNSKATTVIDVAPLTDKLREFFGCKTLEGAYLENDGSDGTSGSHFERKLFVYETMSSGVIFGRRVSKFSLAMLEGSGWYVPDYDFAEPYYFGQGEGCNFIYGSCSSAAKEFSSEFCSGTAIGCTPWGDYAGKCFRDATSEGCSYIMPDKAYSCENADPASNARLPALQVYGRGLGSKCFMGTLNTKSTTSKTPFCFKYSCSGAGSSTKLTVKVGTKSVVCTKAGTKTVSGYYGSITCPDPLSFCNTIAKEFCPRNCMGRGSCVNNKCQCNRGFTGVDCGLNL